MESVVSDGLGGVYGFFDIALFEEVGAMFGAMVFVGVVRPDSGVEVGLELQADRELVVFDVRDLPRR